jgi:uncharacterized protein YjbI with pentapeptide repeats
LPDEQLLNFLTRKVSLEECWGEKIWMINLIVKTFGDLEVGGSGSHFLSESVATRLLAIFKQDYLESAEKLRSPLCGLIGTIKSYGSQEYINLMDVDLSGVNLSGASLREADLDRANLSQANLTGADLSGADLFQADLSWSNLSEAKLFHTVLLN